MVAAAQYNIAANHIDNVQIIRMAAVDVYSGDEWCARV
ncbi:hypothetical protein ACLB1O_22595 [Escherichia coli]